MRLKPAFLATIGTSGIFGAAAAIVHWPIIFVVIAVTVIVGFVWAVCYELFK